MLLIFTIFSQNLVDLSSKILKDQYKSSEGRKENIFFSPLSINVILSKLARGSQGKTREEIMSLMVNYDERKIKGEEAKLANLCLVKEGVILEDQFQKEFDKREISFFKSGTDPALIVKQINNYIKKKSNNFLDKVVDERDIDPTLSLVIANIIYFLADWEVVFKKENNKWLAFNKSIRRFSFMSDQRSVPYTENEQMQMVSLAYKNDWKMLIILPKKNFSVKSVLNKLNSKEFGKWIKDLKSTDVDLKIPKFNIEKKVILNEILQRLGMRLAFGIGGSADFSGITRSGSLYVSKVIHQAKIRVDEEGTEAAAATVVVMLKSLNLFIEKEYIPFIANRPFLFFITDQNYQPIFSGMLNSLN